MPPPPTCAQVPPALRVVLAFAVAVLVAALASCTGNDTGSGAGGPGPGPTTTPTTGEVPTPPPVLAGPADCAGNVACIPGLARVYGLDLAEGFVPTAGGAATVDAVAEGAVAVGVVFSDEPAVADPRLTVLDDDLELAVAGNLVPVIRAGVLRQEPAIDAAADAFAAALTQDALDALTGAVTVEGVAPAAAAAAWYAASGPGGTPAPRSTTVRIGAQDFPGNQVVAHAFAEHLRAWGWVAEVTLLPGTRRYAVDAIANRDVDALVEYAGPLLEYLNGFRGEATADVGATVDRLQDYLVQIGAVAGDPTPGASVNRFVVARTVAAAEGLRTVGDLARLGVATVPAEGPNQGPSGDALLAVAVTTVDPTLGLGARGPQVEQVQRRLVELGYETPVDGRFGQETRSAVVAFQNAQGLPVTGVVGPLTEAALRNPAPSTTTPTAPTTAPPVATTPPPTTTTSAGTTPPAGGPRLFLTFDDGPNARFTPEVLDVLDRFGARATFFVVGAEVVRRPDLTAELVRRGHAVGNHTFNHPDLRRLSRAEFDDELLSTSEAVRSATGSSPTCMRPPFGATNATTVAWSRELGMEVVLWNVDTQDWRRPGAQAIADEIVRGARDGRIVLLHDGGGDRTQTVEGLRLALERLSADGWRFERVPGC